MPSFTPNQIRAIEQNGNVLVLAGAGTGKTRTLVERCVTRLLDAKEPSSLDEMLLVTFTEAAAAEMKRRIRQRLEEKLLASAPTRSHIEAQLTIVDRAHICTLHSFCLHLARNHFHSLQLDPQLTVLTDGQRRLLMEETLELLLRRHFQSGDPFSKAVKEMLIIYGRGAECSIQELLFQLHEYVQTRANPEAWLRTQTSLFEREEPIQWQTWFADAFRQWRERWQRDLQAQPASNSRARDFVRILGDHADAKPKLLFEIIRAEDKDWDGTRMECRKPIQNFFAEAEFLDSLIDNQGGWTPLREDWMWVRQHMLTLLELLAEFSSAFSERKRHEGFLDFNDFERFALQLLWHPDGTLTALAKQYRQQFKWVMVDEYQDINPSQDMILRALSRDGEAANRFLVGDVKQSIYRFRLAEPRIFQDYQKQWSVSGSVIPLSENFRSRARLLDFVNSVVGPLMRSEVGGVEYDAAARLQFADMPERRRLSQPESAVEFHLIVKEKNAAADDDEEDRGTVDLTDAEREARIVASKLWDLCESKFQVWNKEGHYLEEITWKDVVILLRAPADKVEVYARAFHEAGIPFLAQGGGFYNSTEILDLISLLEVLDNPFNDVPILAVLRSPMVGLSLDELAEIRLAKRGEPFWIALKRWHELNRTSPTFSKVDGFLKQFSRWRQMARETTVSQRLERIIEETHYFEWVLMQDRATQRRANIQRFLALAQQFDPLQRLGLKRFLRFIETQREAEQEREPQPVENPNAVRLMSIHQSKGLEFPVVVLPDLGKAFNFRELGGNMLVDDELGLCPKIQPPGLSGKYPSLPFWMAVQRQRPEMLGEEMRLLYVAFTRAQDRLILLGTTTPKQAYEKWPERSARVGEQQFLLTARNYLDWLGPVLCRSGNWSDAPEGEAELFQWRTHTSGKFPVRTRVEKTPGTRLPEALNPVEFASLIKKLEWHYPHEPATNISAKQSATVLSHLARRNAVDEAQQMFPFAPAASTPLRSRLQRRTGLSAAEVGVAHHKFLHLMDFEAAKAYETVIAEAERMEAANFLTSEERKALDFGKVLAFWQSQLGQKVLAHSRQVHREIPFTARCSPAGLRAIGISVDPGLNEDEFFIVRGVVDLAVILEKEIWLLDFKTDGFASDDLPSMRQTYTPQLRLYAFALSRIYRRPATECYLHFLALNQTERITHHT